MNASIIAVGSELLTEDKLDTNSLFLTGQLNSLGVEVVAKAIVGDDRERLAAVIRGEVARNGLVILTGGLGPTEDDVTRDAVAAALGVGQHFDETVCSWIEARFRRLNRVMAENNRRQANVVDGAEVLENPNGTAPGQWLRRDGCVVALLPGPPREMKPMVLNHLLPKLTALLPPMVIRTRFYRVAGLGESDLDSMIAPIYTQFTNPVTTILASEGDIQIHLRARCATEAEALSLLAAAGDPIAEVLGKRIYSRDGSPLDKAVGDLLRQRGETVCTAESCTAGLLAGRFTATSGSSDFFEGAVVAYTDEAKSRLLGIPEELIEEHTAVSEAVARVMASAAKERIGAEWALSLTGYADGPEAGKVWLGMATPAGVEAHLLNLFGNRERVRSMAVIAAMNQLRLRLLN